MPKGNLSWDFFSQERVHGPGPQGNQGPREAALRVLQAAMELELTPRQRQCMELCVLGGLSQEAAGRLLGVNKATVCRHLQKSKRRLARAVRYTALGRTGE